MTKNGITASSITRSTLLAVAVVAALSACNNRERTISDNPVAEGKPVQRISMTMANSNECSIAYLTERTLVLEEYDYVNAIAANPDADQAIVRKRARDASDSCSELVAVTDGQSCLFVRDEHDDQGVTRTLDISEIKDLCKEIDAGITAMESADPANSRPAPPTAQSGQTPGVG